MAKFFLSILTVLFLSMNQAQAATLHAILVGETIGGETEGAGNLGYMKQEIKKIAALTDMDLSAYVFEGWQVRKDSVLKTISDLIVLPEDRIVILFNMHGSRTHQKENRWPDLCFHIDLGFSGESGNVDFNDINEIVKSKCPRFMISIADSCNSYRDEADMDDEDEDDDEEEDENEENEDDFIVSPIPSYPFEYVWVNPEEISFYKQSTDEDEVEMYRHLFLDQTGSIVVSSSSPGETAMKLPVTGGIFTVNFLRSLYYASIGFETPSWESILDQASESTKKEVIFHGKEPYTPQYEINLNPF